jgi:hypothetical protein
MRLFVTLLFIFLGSNSFGQDKVLLQYKKQFDQDLKFWASTFSGFKLSDFKACDTLHFDNNLEQDFNYFKEFLATYKPIITYSPDSSKFIDIYSYQLNLEKKGNVYYANPDIDQTIYLCNPKGKYWNRIHFGGGSQWIDEVAWISETNFILVGITKIPDDKKTPLILLGDTNKQTLIKCLSADKEIIQSSQKYSSPKLKKIVIKKL